MRGQQLSFHVGGDGAPKRPRASYVQGVTGQADTDLTLIAKRRHPLILWWFGIRKVNDQTCAYCYVCDQVIVIAALNAHISQSAVDQINEHRASHWGLVRDYRAEGSH